MAENPGNDTQKTNVRDNVIIVDFDFALMDGYEILELAAENALGVHNVELTRGIFLRKLLGARAMPALASLLPENAEIAPEKFVAQVYEAADKAVDGAPIRKAVLDFIKNAEAQETNILFVTARNQTVVEQKLENAGISEPRVIRVDKGEVFGAYNRDAWNKAVRIAYPASGNCLLLLGGAQSVKDALALGRRGVSTFDGDEECVILPSILVARVAAIVSPVISYQDYAGADYVFDAQPDAALAKSLASVVF